MEDSEHLIHITKQARYYTWGKDITTARYIWFDCHGYGQLGKYFIKNFHGLDPSLHFVVAPEGFHRFYLDGFSGRVGATWMTREARLDDIADYVSFLDQVCEQSGIAARSKGQDLIAFGFSQGVATVARWIALGAHPTSMAMFWSGSFPPDLEPVKAMAAFENLPVLACIGDQDPLVKGSDMEAARAHYQKMGITPQTYTFSGAHNIPREALDVAFSKLAE
jgi:predicted esterase